MEIIRMDDEIRAMVITESEREVVTVRPTTKWLRDIFGENALTVTLRYVRDMEFAVLCLRYRPEGTPTIVSDGTGEHIIGPAVITGFGRSTETDGGDRLRSLTDGEVMMLAWATVLARDGSRPMAVAMCMTAGPDGHIAEVTL